jgi:hypothetical protein
MSGHYVETCTSWQQHGPGQQLQVHQRTRHQRILLRVWQSVLPPQVQHHAYLPCNQLQQPAEQQQPTTASLGRH